ICPRKLLRSRVSAWSSAVCATKTGVISPATSAKAWYLTRRASASIPPAESRTTSTGMTLAVAPTAQRVGRVAWRWPPDPPAPPANAGILPGLLPAPFHPADHLTPPTAFPLPALPTAQRVRRLAWRCPPNRLAHRDQYTARGRWSLPLVPLHIARRLGPANPPRRTGRHKPVLANRVAPGFHARHLAQRESAVISGAKKVRYPCSPQTAFSIPAAGWPWHLVSRERLQYRHH